MIELTQKAFNKFKANNTKYNTKEVSQLEEALTNYLTFTPCEQVRNHQAKNPGLPLQLVRDTLIVDYLHSELGLTFNRATDLWCDWEDYEFEIRSN